MPGQWSNFFKNFGKAIISKGIDSYKYVEPYIKVGREVSGIVKDVGGILKTGIDTGYDIFTNLNNLDDPNRSDRDKVVDVVKTGLDVVGLIPGIGSIVSTVGNKVVDAATYVQDVMEGRKDPPPKGEDIHGKDPVSNMGSTIFNSTPFKNYFNNFGLV
jgi:hypothetical protein